jgi:hypothetical protein
LSASLELPHAPVEIPKKRMSKHLLQAITKLIFFRTSHNQNSFWIALEHDNSSVPLYEGLLPSNFHPTQEESKAIMPPKLYANFIYLVGLV